MKVKLHAFYTLEEYRRERMSVSGTHQLQVWMWVWWQITKCNVPSVLFANFCALQPCVTPSCVNCCPEAFRHLLMPSSGSQSTVALFSTDLQVESGFISSAEWLQILINYLFEDRRLNHRFICDLHCYLKTVPDTAETTCERTCFRTGFISFSFKFVWNVTTVLSYW